VKKLLAAAGITAAMTGIAVAGMGTASANDQSFLDVVHGGIGLVNDYGDGALLAQGYQTCANLDYGWTGMQVVRGYFYDNNVSAYQAGQFVRAAVDELCPRHLGGILVSARTGI
jgi:Protein of unknown function (DUF732)